MTAITPIPFSLQPKKVQSRIPSAIRQRVNRLHDEAASGVPEAVCAILLGTCLITAFGQCFAQIVA